MTGIASPVSGSGAAALNVKATSLADPSATPGDSLPALSLAIATTAAPLTPVPRLVPPALSSRDKSRSNAPLAEELAHMLALWREVSPSAGALLRFRGSATRTGDEKAAQDYNQITLGREVGVMLMNALV